MSSARKLWQLAEVPQSLVISYHQWARVLLKVCTVIIVHLHAWKHRVEQRLWESFLKMGRCFSGSITSRRHENIICCQNLAPAKSLGSILMLIPGCFANTESLNPKPLHAVLACGRVFGCASRVAPVKVGLGFGT